MFADDSGVFARLSHEATAALGRITSRDGLAVPEAIEQAALNENFLLDLEYNGGCLLMLQANGRLRRVERSEAGA